VPPDLVADTVSALVHDIVDVHGGHLNTGMLGTKYLLPVLTEQGFGDVALTVATRQTHPSWGFWRAQGATTFWEAWDLTSRSRAHSELGTVSQRLREYVAGIRPVTPGFQRFAVRPLLDKRLDHAAATYQSHYGEINVSWTRRAESTDLMVTVPVGTTAVVELPLRDTITLDSGRHHLTAA
jgi:alpha-L-rhamnosidase